MSWDLMIGNTKTTVEAAAEDLGKSRAIRCKHAREVLGESESRYRYLFERSLAGIYVADSAGRVLDCNDAFARIVGATTRRAVLYLPDWDLYPAGAQGARLELALRESGELRNEELELRRIDGEPVLVLANIVVVDAPAGRGTVVQGTVLDISEQRQLEDRLQRSRQMEATSRLAGGVAHDFNNILTSILGYTELSLDDAEPEGALHGNLLEIQEAGRLAALLTRQLLAFGRGQVLRPSLLDVNEVVRGFAGLLENSAGEGVEFELFLDPDRPFVRADRRQLEIVLMDLATNARDAMPEGGRLTIITANVELDGAFARQHAGSSVGSHVMLSMADTGCGMEEETLKRAFEPFFTTKRENAPGLGLAAVYGIVKQSGGYIHLESELGVGTTFDIYLPKAVETEASRSGRIAGRRRSTGTRRILLAEDDRRLRNMAEKVLTREGYEVFAAGDGAESLAIAESFDQPFDLLITDLVMPGMSGLELGKRLAERDSRLRVLLMSGYPRDHRLDEDEFATNAAFIGKPFKPSELIEEVRTLLDIDFRGSSAESCGLSTEDDSS